MEIFGDYHIHTTASDGMASLVDQTKSAISVGLKEIAVTDHSWNTLLSSMSHHKFDRQTEAISMMHHVDDMNIKIYHGIEGNLLNRNGDMDIPDDIMPKLDLLACGFHRFLEATCWDKNMKYLLVNGFAGKKAREKMIAINTWAFLSAMERYPIDVLVHLQHRALVDIKAICEKAREKDVYIELNEKHIKQIEPCIGDIIESGVKLIVGSDAHTTGTVGKFTNTIALIEKYNIPTDRIAGIGCEPKFKDKSNYKVEK